MVSEKFSAYLGLEGGVSWSGLMAADEIGGLAEDNKLGKRESERERERLMKRHSCSNLPCRRGSQLGSVHSLSSGEEAVSTECSEHLHTQQQVPHYVCEKIEGGGGIS